LTAGRIRCFTSITVSYLAKARVLADSVREHHPDWELTVVLSEPVPDWLDVEAEPFDAIVGPEDLDIPALAGWMFAHRLVEACTGVKGPALELLLHRPDTAAVVYLDPDIRLYRPLDAVIDALTRGSIVLTPHQLDAETDDLGVWENEVTALAHGVYNLGFLGVKADEQGARFARWWRDRLVDYCFDDRAAGLFTDQRWCDLVPALFDRHVILRDPAYNVAPWNVSQRPLTRTDEDGYLVDAGPLAFFHFSGSGGDGLTMTWRHAPAESAVHQLWEEYLALLAAAGQADVAGHAWAYGTFDDGTPILPAMRQRYRHNPEVRAAFADPFAVDPSAPTFLDWWRANEGAS